MSSCTLDSDQQTLIDMNDDPLPPGSPPIISSMSSSQLQRQLASDMETISVMSARSEHNLSAMNQSKTSLNTSVASAATHRSMNSSLQQLDGNGQPPAYEDLQNPETLPAPSAGILRPHSKEKKPKGKIYNKQNEENTDPRHHPPSRKELPQSCRIPQMSEQDRFIHCKVCHAFINVKNKLHQSVVRCSHCREATAIKAAPAGKQYVRCPCDCLLVCKSNSSRIMCPRANCNRTITVVKKPSAQASGTGSQNLSQGSVSKISTNVASGGPSQTSQALVSANSQEQAVTSRSVHSLNGVQDDTYVSSPYSAARRNPAYGSNSSINTTEQKRERTNTGNNRHESSASSTQQLLEGVGGTGVSSTGRYQNQRPHNPMNGPRLVRLQCAFCHMEFVRMTPLTSYGTCPHCEVSMPFGNRYKRVRQWIFFLLTIATLATSLTLQNTKVLDPSGNNSQFNLMFVGLYVLSGIFFIIAICYSCMKVTHISESEL